ncbi:MAG: gephyrin-like molybdotransferase Glp [Synechococcales bacterium]|nr:gephyrin-like molybdotransferase Glp [Synechococcales bacterium]
MQSVQEAESSILGQVNPLDPLLDRELVVLSSSCQRILAQPVTSQSDFPHWDNSAMDGYAVQFADVAACATDRPVRLEIIEEIPAGVSPKKTLQSGQAARILTGSMLPAGADTIVMQENTQRQGDWVQILQAPTAIGQFVRSQASFYQAGQILLPAGQVITAAELAILAAAQCLQVTVYRRPKVAILSTGSELISPEQRLQPGQIVDSNQYALTALTLQAGAEVLPLGIVPDDPIVLKTAIAAAISQADVVISSGGVSVGDYDYVDQILAELGGKLHLRAIAVKPGKPLTFATFSQARSSTLYFGLPGNPVSALVTFCRFVQPALRKLMGYPSDQWLPAYWEATTLQPLLGDRKRESYLWGKLITQRGENQFTLATGNHSSGNLINLAGCNALAIVPMGANPLAGDRVTVMPIAPSALA